MSRARSAIAARTTVQALREALCKSFGVEDKGSELHTDFYDVGTFCRANSEELGGDEGAEAWYFWQSGEWAVAGDLTLELLSLIHI